MRGIRCALAAVLAAGIVTVVAAQPGRQPGGFGQDVNTLVFTNVALQEEIKLTAEQKEKIKPVADKQADLAKKRADMFKGGKDGFDKEKFTELQDAGKKVAEESKKILGETLTAEQKKRLKQISVQQIGVQAFGEPVEGKGGFGGTSEATKATMKEVQDALKLTDDQKSKIKTITEELAKDRTAIRKDIFGDKKGGGADPEKQKEFQTKSDKLSKDAMGKISETLDDTQKKAWKELTGEAFDLAKLRPVTPKKD